MFSFSKNILVSIFACLISNFVHSITISQTHCSPEKTKKLLTFRFAKVLQILLQQLWRWCFFFWEQDIASILIPKIFQTRKPNGISKGKNKNFAQNQNIQKLLKPCHELKNYLLNYFQALWPTSMRSSK